MNGEAENVEELDIPIRVNSGMGVDAIIGKATRKARCWLFNSINGTEISDGDVTEDADVTVLGSKTNEPAPELEDLQYLFDMKKEVLTADELADAERILTNQETNSYNKLFKLLQSK
jgi:hypothetical protein